MTLSETDKLLSKIKSFHQYFEKTDEKVKDWYIILKNYDYKEVCTKLNRLSGSFETGNIVPTISMLIEGLKSNKKVEIENCDVYCPYCERYIELNKYDKHRDKCASISYFLNEYKRITNKEFPREKLEVLSNEVFKKQYDTLLRMVQNNPTYSEQLIYIENYFGNEIETDVKEIIRKMV